MECHIETEQLLKKYLSIRHLTEKLCQPLLIEDYVIQSCDDVSPPKWHLAHTTWFYETFILANNITNYQFYDPLYTYLFNSYYQTLGEFCPRVRRGTLARPTVADIYTYRQYVDELMQKLIINSSPDRMQEIYPLIILGLHHEQQHQELLLTDIKHNLSLDPSFPCYSHNNLTTNAIKIPTLNFIHVKGGLIDIGYQNNAFCFDNELPAHKVFIEPYAIASRLITNEEYLEFILADGYANPNWWLADGWDYVQKYHWQAPLYWQNIDDEWFIFTLRGLQKLDLTEPVSHVSFYEADAYARFKACRLLTEFEWEFYVRQTENLNANARKLDSLASLGQDGNFLENEVYHPRSWTRNQSSNQLYGDVWEWTMSAYLPYPGYQPLHGSLGEYNGKFMSNQMVLRGGSCVTPQSHIRSSYRNFFQPEKRWQFTGIRLAQNV